jgi:hypothetical protein
VINNENWNGFFSWFKFQTELFLNRSEQRWSRIIRDGCIVGSPLQLEIITACEIGLVHDDPAGNLLKLFCNQVHRQPLAVEVRAARTDTSPAVL